MINKICPTCKKQLSHPLDIEALDKLGECLMCDSHRSEISSHFEYPGLRSQPMTPEVQEKIDNDKPF